MNDPRRHAAATLRNRDPILAVLREVLPPRGTVLEIACGSGEHALYFAAALPHLLWQPSDVDAEALQSTAAWRDSDGPANLLPPVRLDVTEAAWPVETVDAVFSANLVHISPWEACLGLLAGAARHLTAEGLLVLYGPYKLDGRHTAPSNEAFDRDLRRRNAAWGVRDVADLVTAAAREGLALDRTIAMPANNQILVWRRS